MPPAVGSLAKNPPDPVTASFALVSGCATGASLVPTVAMRTEVRVPSALLTLNVSAPTLVGGYLFDRSRKPLTTLAKSPSLWERRIAMVATQHFIRLADFADTFRIAALLLGDKHDLIHKAAGWMLREVGKRDQPALEAFLAEHYARMPRTMLRYAIEKFSPERRLAYLQGQI